MKDNFFRLVSKFEGLIMNFGLGSRENQEIILFGGNLDFQG